MKGTILDFLKLAAEKPELARDLIDLAVRHDFTFTDELSEEELEGVSGGRTMNDAQIAGGTAQGAQVSRYSSNSGSNKRSPSQQQDLRQYHRFLKALEGG